MLDRAILPPAALEGGSDSYSLMILAHVPMAEPSSQSSQEPPSTEPPSTESQTAGAVWLLIGFLGAAFQKHGTIVEHCSMVLSGASILVSMLLVLLFASWCFAWSGKQLNFAPGPRVSLSGHFLLTGSRVGPTPGCARLAWKAAAASTAAPTLSPKEEDMYKGAGGLENAGETPICFDYLCKRANKLPAFGHQRAAIHACNPYIEHQHEASAWRRRQRVFAS